MKDELGRTGKKAATSDISRGSISAVGPVAAPSSQVTVPVSRNGASVAVKLNAVDLSEKRIKVARVMRSGTRQAPADVLSHRR